MDDITLDRCESCGHPTDHWCDDECCWWKAERFLEGMARDEAAQGWYEQHYRPAESDPVPEAMWEVRWRGML